MQSHLALPKETSSSPLTLDEFKALASTLDRCEISGISDNLLRACIEAARADPAVAYAYAYKFHFDDMKLIACRLTLEKPLFPLPASPELDVLGVSQYSRLLQYHREAETAVSRLALEDWSWMSWAEIPPQCGGCYVSLTCAKDFSMNLRIAPSDTPNQYYLQDGMVRVYGAKWWSNFMEKTGSALGTIPCG